jgi:hypothetical protein
MADDSDNEAFFIAYYLPQNDHFEVVEESGLTERCVKGLCRPISATPSSCPGTTARQCKIPTGRD